MSMRVELDIEAFRKAAGIKVPEGKEAALLREMSDRAFELIKVVELELSGIRDGNGYWNGADVIGAVTNELIRAIRKHHDTSGAKTGFRRYQLRRRSVDPAVDPSEPK